MIRHSHLQARVLWRDELTLAEQVKVQRHLESCPACWQAAQLQETNRSRLRTLSQIRPPAELRQAVLSVADESHHAFRTYLPMALTFLLMPIILLTYALLLAYGLLALVGLFSLIVGSAGHASWKATRRRAEGEVILRRKPSEEAGDILRVLAVDALGLGVGALLLLVLIGFLALVSGHRLPFGSR